jgi:hypothetical protein
MDSLFVRIRQQYGTEDYTWQCRTPPVAFGQLTLKSAAIQLVPRPSTIVKASEKIERDALLKVDPADLVSSEPVTEDNQCVVCLDRAVSVTSQPCGHRSCCVVCAQRVFTCPLCRKPIEAAIKDRDRLQQQQQPPVRSSSQADDDDELVPLQ